MSTASRCSSGWRGELGVDRRLGRLPADLVGHGLGPPPLGISDGAAGLIGAFEQHFRTSLRQRCLVHRARNTLAKVSVHDQDEVKADFWAVFDIGEVEPGDQAVAVAQQQAAAFAAK